MPPVLPSASKWGWVASATEAASRKAWNVDGDDDDGDGGGGSDDVGDGGDGSDDGGEGSNGSDDGGDDKSNLTWSVEAVGEALEKRLEASSRRLSRGHGYQQCLQCLLGG